MSDQIQINGSQVDTLAAVLTGNADGEPVLLTQQGDGSLVVAFNLATIEITTAGTDMEV